MKSQNTLLKLLEKYWWAVCIVAGVLVAVLSLVVSNGQAMWFDEGYSILLAREPIGEILSLTAVDAHPPFYYLLLKLWATVFGFDGFALRALSALLMGGAVAVILALIKRQFSVRVALAVIPFLVLAPFILRYGYEVRMYALATFIGVSATYAMVRAQVSKGWAWWVVYAGLVALGMYTLYMMIALWVAHVVWLLVTSIRQRQSIRSWKWLYALGGAVLLFAPYIPTFFYQLTHSALPGIGHEVTLTQLVDISSILTLYTSEWQLSGWLSPALGAVLLLVIILGVVSYQRATKAHKSLILFWLILAIVPLIFFTLTSLPPRSSIFINRYLAHVAIFIYATGALLIVLGWRYGYRKLATAAAAALFGLLLLGVVNLQQAGNFIFERQQHPMTQLIREHVTCDADTVVVADDPYTYIDSVFYYNDCDIRFFSEYDLERKGGYAMLHGSDRRVDGSESLTAPRLAHLRWDGQDASFVPDARYQLVQSTQYEKQVVDIYELIVE